MQIVEEMCTDAQIRCRDACFSTVGETKNGCELIARQMYGFTRLVLGDGALYTFDNEDRALRIDTADLSVTPLATTAELDRHAPVVYAQGWLYGRGRTEQGTFRLSTSDGTSEQVAAEVGPLYVAGDDVYVLATDERDNVQRVRSGAAELLFEGDVSSLVVSGDAYYYHRGFSDFAFFTSPISDPTMETELSTAAGVGFEAISGYVFVRPSEPEYVYLVGNNFSRVVVASGDVELVADEFGMVGGAAGPEYFVFSRRSNLEDPGIFALSYDGMDKIALDPYGDSQKGLASDDSYFYFARDDGLFRIAQP